jgi:hypothetical protein
MIPDDLSDEKRLRAWAVEQVLGSTSAALPPGTDFIAAAQRIVAFVKNGPASNGRKRT